MKIKNILLLQAVVLYQACAKDPLIASNRHSGYGESS